LHTTNLRDRFCGNKWLVQLRDMALATSHFVGAGDRLCMKPTESPRTSNACRHTFRLAGAVAIHFDTENLRGWGDFLGWIRISRNVINLLLLRFFLFLDGGFGGRRWSDRGHLVIPLKERKLENKGNVHQLGLNIGYRTQVPYNT